MNRLSVVKRAFFGASVALIALVTPRVAMAQAAAAQDADPLKFAVSKPTVVGWVSPGR